MVRYSALSLSYESDRLPALSGIASRFCGAGLRTYAAGLWREDLARGLLWYVGFDWISSSQRPLPLQAPTWSWASILLDKKADCVFYPFILDSDNQFHQEPAFRVLDVQCRPSGINPFGQVTDGVLVLQSSFNTAICTVRKNLRPFVELVLDSDIDDMVLISAEPLYADVALGASDMDDSPTTASRLVHCLFLGSSTTKSRSSDGSEWAHDYGIVVVSSVAKEDRYERIGFVQTARKIGADEVSCFDRTSVGVFRLM